MRGAASPAAVWCVACVRVGSLLVSNFIPASLVCSACPPPSILLTAEFDAGFLLDELPKVLGIEEKRVRMLLKELVGARK